MTDYEVIVEQAEKQGYEFFIIQGKAYFRKRQKVTSALMTEGTGPGNPERPVLHVGSSRW